MLERHRIVAPNNCRSTHPATLGTAPPTTAICLEPCVRAAAFAVPPDGALHGRAAEQGKANRAGAWSKVHGAPGRVCACSALCASVCWCAGVRRPRLHHLVERACHVQALVNTLPSLIPHACMHACQGPKVALMRCRELPGTGRVLTYGTGAPTAPRRSFLRTPQPCCCTPCTCSPGCSTLPASTRSRSAGTCCTALRAAARARASWRMLTWRRRACRCGLLQYLGAWACSTPCVWLWLAAVLACIGSGFDCGAPHAHRRCKGSAAGVDQGTWVHGRGGDGEGKLELAMDHASPTSVTHALRPFFVQGALASVASQVMDLLQGAQQGAA